MTQLSFGDEFEDALDDATYSVADVAAAINRALRRQFDDGLWVRGEIQGLNARGPHLYFRLVEDGEQGKAVLNVQFFAPQQNRLRPLLAKHRLRLADGLRVRIFGHLDYFAAGGTIGLKMAGIDPRFTLGDLAQQRTDVVRRLVAAGLYDANKARRLSPAPLRVGVVTSRDSAAWADFRHELERSGIAFQVRLADVRVQGEFAVPEVAAAVNAFGRRDDLDVVVVIRGGGAKSELATFDAEAIAVAIAECPYPVLTGLGHETDSSIADEVAHRALKTPTACAAALVESVMGYLQRTESAWEGIQRIAERNVQRAEQRLAEAGRGIARHTAMAVERADERLAHRRARLVTASVRSLTEAHRTVGALGSRLRRAPQRLDAEERLLNELGARVRLLDPVNVLARGWSITRTADGHTVRDAATLRTGDTLVTTFAAGSASSTVQETHS